MESFPEIPNPNVPPDSEEQEQNTKESTEYLENDALEVYQWEEFENEDLEYDSEGNLTQIRIPSKTGEYYPLSNPVNISEMQRPYVSVTEEEEGQKIEVKDTEQTFQEIERQGAKLERLRKKEGNEENIQDTEYIMRDGIQEVVEAYGKKIHEVDKNEEEVEYWISEPEDSGQVRFWVKINDNEYYIEAPNKAQADNIQEYALDRDTFAFIEYSSGKIKTWPKHTETGYYIRNERTAEWLRELLEGSSEPYIEDSEEIVEQRQKDQVENDVGEGTKEIQTQTEGEEQSSEEAQSEEREEASEVLENKSPETRQALEAFLQFVSQHQETLSAAQDEEDLKEYIYSNFYASGESLTEEQLETLHQQHDGELQNMIRELQDKEVQYVENHNDFTYAVLNEGLSDDDPTGRLYMNVSPESMYQQFTVIADSLQKEGINGQMKIDRESSESTYTRPDKVVVYFNGDQSEELLSLMEELQNKEELSFEANLPQFTTEIQEGIGFGEEPESGSSFGDIRSQILADIYTYAQENSVSLDEWSQELEDKLQDICREYGVDPDDMAFNSIEEGEEHPFEAIRAYVREEMQSTENEQTESEDVVEGEFVEDEETKSEAQEPLIELTEEQGQQFQQQMEKIIAKKEEKLNQLAEELADVEEQYEGFSKIWNKIGKSARDKQNVEQKYQRKLEEYKEQKEEVIRLKTMLETREEIGNWFRHEQERYQNIKSEEKEQKKSGLEKMGEEFLNWYSRQKWYTKLGAGIGIAGASAVLGGGVAATAGALGVRSLGSASMGRGGFEIARQKLENGKLYKELKGLEQMSAEQIAQLGEEYTSDRLATLDGYAALNGGEVPEQYQDVYAALQKHYGELLADKSKNQNQQDLERTYGHRSQAIDTPTKHALSLRGQAYETGKEKIKHKRNIAKRWGYGTAAAGFGLSTALGSVIDSPFANEPGSSAEPDPSKPDPNTSTENIDPSNKTTPEAEQAPQSKPPESDTSNGLNDKSTPNNNSQEDIPKGDPNGGNEQPTRPESSPEPSPDIEIDEIYLDQGSTIWEEVEGVLENKGLDASDEHVQELVHSYLNSKEVAEDMFNRAMDIPDGQEYLQQIGGEHPTVEDVQNMNMDQKHELARRLGPGELPHLDNILEQQLNENVTDATSPESPNSGNISEPNQEPLEKSNSEASSQQTMQRPDQENVPPSKQQHPFKFTVSSEPSSDTEPTSTQPEQQATEQTAQDPSTAGEETHQTENDTDELADDQSKVEKQETSDQITEQTEELTSEQTGGEQVFPEQVISEDFDSQVQYLKEEVRKLSANDLRVQKEGKIYNMSESILKEVFSIHEMPPSQDLNSIHEMPPSQNLNLSQEVEKIYSSMPKEALNQFFDTDAGKEWLYEQLEENSSLLEKYNIENAEQLSEKLSENGKKYGILWKHLEVFPKGTEVKEFKEFLMNSDFLQNKLEELQEATRSADNNTSK